MSEPSTGRVYAMLRRTVDVRPGEVRTMLVSFAYFFFVLSGWFVLRPMREAVAVATGVNKLPFLFAGTLAAVLVANPLFAALVVRYPVRKFIAITYHFFIANILVFYALMTFVAPVEGSAADVWIGRVFFVWTSVFNLFVVSIFWAFMADTFRSEQAKRLFGFIAVGGSLGSVIGSAVTAELAPRIGTPNLLLLSATLIELAVLCVLRFPARQRAADGEEAVREDQPIGGSLWAGFSHVTSSPYLLGISAFLILLTMGSTILYFEQTDIVGKAYADRAARTAVMARIELVVQSLTLVTQIFLTGRLIRWLGLARSMAFLPLVSLIGFAALGTWPVFAVVAAMAVLRRAGNFALNNPSMEILFTVVPREDKYKAKNFIETFVYRAGDQIGAWGYAGLAALGLGMSGIAYAAVPLAFIWLLLGVWLGREQGRIGARQA
ncbi:MAG: MFS transporter [Gemmatimonadota bacterium]|nr:MFS transporter [Gemmatimonadota bacterium]